MPETRTYWLSFVDPDRPSGQKFLGVCIVDVTDADVRAVRDEVRAKFPTARDGAEWIAAASRCAWTHGCNPGGEILSVWLNDPKQDPRDGSQSLRAVMMPDALDDLPRNRLLTFPELEAWGKPIHA